MIPSPEHLEYLPYQMEGIEFCARRTCILGDEMGLGKTIQAIGVINNDLAIKRVLVVCPVSLKLNWRRELGAWLVRPFCMGMVGQPLADGPAAPGDTLIAIIGYDSIVKFKDRLCRKQWDLLICDEAQYLKNPDAQRTRGVLGYKGRKKDYKKEPPIPAKHTLFLSGTPILNAPVELWPMLQLLDSKGLGRAYWPYVKRYCGPRRTRFGMNVRGMSNGKELHSRLTDGGIMLRRLKKDVLSQLPPKRRQILQIPTTSSMDRLIASEVERYDNYQAYLRTHGKKKDATIPFADLAAARQNVALAKVPEIKRMIAEGLETGPIVVFAHHHKVIDALAEDFKHVKLTGQSTVEQREHAVRAFQAGKCDLFMGNIQAAGVGITLTRSAHIIFAEIDWTPALMEQAEDRCHRIGQEQSLLIQLPVLEGSLDSRMVKTIVRKQRITRRVLDGE